MRPRDRVEIGSSWFLWSDHRSVPFPFADTKAIAQPLTAKPSSTLAQQEFLVRAGREGVVNFLKWYRSKSGQRDIARIYRDMAPSD